MNLHFSEVCSFVGVGVGWGSLFQIIDVHCQICFLRNPVKWTTIPSMRWRGQWASIGQWNGFREMTPWQRRVKRWMNDINNTCLGILSTVKELDRHIFVDGSMAATAIPQVAVLDMISENDIYRQEDEIKMMKIFVNWLVLPWSTTFDWFFAELYSVSN